MSTYRWTINDEPPMSRKEAQSLANDAYEAMAATDCENRNQALRIGKYAPGAQQDEDSDE